MAREPTELIAPAPHRGTTVLVLGVAGLMLGLLMCGPLAMPLGIAAWVMGNRDLAAMDSGRMDRSGRDTTNIGRILGQVAVALSCFLVFLVVILVAIWHFIYGTPPPAGLPPWPGC